MKHYAIQSEHISVKGSWAKNLLKGNTNNELRELNGKKGVLFSNVTLEKLIDDEMRHDNFALSPDKERSIRTYSSGEQKKALLEYLMSQQPDFVILDNPFDCLDVQSVANLKERITGLSNEVCFIQLFKRVDDIMPFINDILILDDEQYVKTLSVTEFVAHAKTKNICMNDPLPGRMGAPIEVNDELVRLHNVCVHYDDRTILNNINWEIRKGEFWQLIGPNGSGKTTILSMIYGDNPKAFGVDLFLFGHKKGTGESVWEIKEKMGYFSPAMTELFNGNHSADNMVVSGLVDSIGLYRKVGDVQMQLAHQWLQLLDLYDKKDELFYKLSQIEQRMLLIARAMIKHPPLLILDEPSTGLDDEHAALMVALINKIAEESNTTIVYVSHRKEPGLRPHKNYLLVPGESGSVGLVEEN